MSHRQIADQSIPRLPVVPATGPDAAYIDRLVRSLESAIMVLNSTRFRTFTEINLTNTQEHGGGLRVGDVYSDNGFLKIVRTGDVLAGTLSSKVAVGTVTVTTT